LRPNEGGEPFYPFIYGFDRWFMRMLRSPSRIIEAKVA
jgi:hypothetical protein